MTSADQLIEELDHARQILRNLLQDLEAAHATAQEIRKKLSVTRQQ